MIGDFNVRVGPKDVRFPFHESTNRYEKYLVDLSLEKNLFITNTYFQKKIGNRWTYISPGGTKCQLNYIRVRRTWKNLEFSTQTHIPPLPAWDPTTELSLQESGPASERVRPCQKESIMIGRHSVLTKTFRIVIA